MPEGRMAQVMRQSDSFREILIQAQRAADVPRDGCDLNRVRQPRPQMVAGAVKKNLGLILEPAKGPRMNNTIPVPLIFGSPFRGRFLILAPSGIGAELGVRSEVLLFELFEFLASAGHLPALKPSTVPILERAFFCAEAGAVER